MTQTKSNYKVGRLIIVDDETELMTALCEILTRHGYETVGYTSGAEALAKMKEQDFDLLLTDLMMPEMNGIELLQAALEIDPAIVGIVMTGQGTVQTAVEAMKTGALDYIMKPFKLNSLLPVLSRAMEVRYLRTENMHLRETVAMHELGQALAFSSDLNQILNKVTDAVLQQCDADEASIMLPTSDGKELIIAVARGGHAEHIGKRIAMGQGIAGWVAQNREPVTLNGEVHDERFTSINPRADISTAVSIPMIVGGSLIGVLNVNITRPHRPFTLGQVKTLIMLATIVSPILENARLYAEKKRAEDIYKTLAEGSLAAVFIVQDGKICFINAAVASLGYSAEELIGRHPDTMIHPEDREMAKKMGGEMLRGEHTTPYEFRTVTKQGQIRWLMQIVSPILFEERPAILGNAIDVTELKKAEEALRESEEKYRNILENMNDSYFETDLRGTMTFCNPMVSKSLGYSPEEMAGMNHRTYMDLENAEIVERNFQGVYRENIPSKLISYKVTKKDGTKAHIETSVSLIKNKDGRPVGYRGMSRDITEREQAAAALRESEEKYRALVETTDTGFVILDGNGTVLDANKNYIKMTGRKTLDEIRNRNVIEWTSQHDLERNAQAIKKCFDQGFIRDLEVNYVSKEGDNTPVEISATLVETNEGKRILSLCRDITGRKQAEEFLRQAEERYRSIFENAQEGIFQTTCEGQYLAANRALATILGYDSPEELMTTVIDITTQLYVDPEVRKALLKMIEEQGPVKEFETQFYKKDGSIIWVSVNQHAVRDAGGRVLHYEGFNEDITMKKGSIERMKKALWATVQAIAVTVETRDPYTAGHQRRVADLARAIAMEMNIPTDQIDGILMAAIIHDIGKISVPAEILSKPSKLTDLEFGLIKTHAQSGYDILKDIEFPWPIARMVLEHHERMDGSGYPGNLNGDDILMEARILAVSDVVEAMGSHRPYRPSRGIDAALEEIENKRGTHYDTSTVDACLRLFREKGYQLEGTSF